MNIRVLLYNEADQLTYYIRLKDVTEAGAKSEQVGNLETESPGCGRI
jgi:hypothetical protein